MSIVIFMDFGKQHTKRLKIINLFFVEKGNWFIDIEKYI